MKTLNKVSLIGNLGKDPELRYLHHNTPVSKIALATTKTFTDSTGKRHTHTDRHTVILWTGLAELAAKHFHKGSLIYIEGKQKNRAF